MSCIIRKGIFAYAKTKMQISCAVTTLLILHLCFHFIDSSIPLLPKYEISSLQPSSVAVQPGLCRTMSETLKTGFLTMWLKFTLFPFSSAQKSRVVAGQKKVLILGAGYVAGPAVNYLCRDKDVHVTVGKSQQILGA